MGGEKDSAKKQKVGTLPERTTSKRMRRSEAVDEVDSASARKDETPNDDWKPPVPKPGSWEDKVAKVESMEQDTYNCKWVFLQWSEPDENGRNRKSKVLLDSAHIACPQQVSCRVHERCGFCVLIMWQMCKYYETHL